MQRGRPLRRRLALQDVVDRLIFLRREGRDVDERLDLVVIAGLRDHGAGPGMADQNHRAVLLLDHAARGGHVAIKRIERILYRHDVQAFCLEQWNHLVPARAIGESTMHEHDILAFQIIGRSGGASGRQRADRKKTAEHDRGGQALFEQGIHNVDPRREVGQNGVKNALIRRSAVSVK